MAKIDDSVKKKVPELRFPGFTDDWEERKLGEVYNFQYGQFNNNPDNGGQYPIYGANGIIGGYDEYNSENAIVIGHMGAYAGHVLWAEGKHFVTYNGTMGIADKSILNSNFGYYLVVSVNVPKLTAGSGQPFVSYSDLNGIKILIPTIEEQQKIGSFFQQLDNTITLHQLKLDLLKEQKKGYLQKMFPKNGEKVPELRFAGFADDWEERKFKDILKTHSFRSYLADGSDDGKYEVIQQGNNPIVGYSDGEPFTDYKDITLFGDHTVSLYNPQSPFFIATDGVKILSADNFEGDYLYTTLERYKPAPQGYKRHFTILKNKDLCFTRNVEEQKQIGSFFKQLDNTITLHQRKLDLLKEQKKGYLQKMFV